MVTLRDLSLDRMGDRAVIGAKTASAAAAGLCWSYAGDFMSDILACDCTPTYGEFLASDHMRMFCAMASMCAFDIPAGNASIEIPRKLTELDINNEEFREKARKVAICVKGENRFIPEFFDDYRHLCMSGVLSMKYGQIHTAMSAVGYVGSAGNEDPAITKMKCECMRFLTLMSMSEMVEPKNPCFSSDLVQSVPEWFLGQWIFDGFTIALTYEPAAPSSQRVVFGDLMSMSDRIALINILPGTRERELVKSVMDARADAEKKDPVDVRLCIPEDMEPSIRNHLPRFKEVVLREYTAEDYDSICASGMDTLSMKTARRAFISISDNKSEDVEGDIEDIVRKALAMEGCH